MRKEIDSLFEMLSNERVEREKKEFEDLSIEKVERERKEFEDLSSEKVESQKEPFSSEWVEREDNIFDDLSSERVELKKKKNQDKGTKNLSFGDFLLFLLIRYFTCRQKSIFLLFKFVKFIYYCKDFYFFYR